MGDSGSHGRRLFVFDMDDVLGDYDADVRMAALAAATGLDAARLRDRWWLAGEEAQAEAGAYATGAAYLAAFVAAIGAQISETEWLLARRAAMRPRPACLAAVRRAAELGRVTLLTNNGALMAEHLAELAPELAEIFGADLLTTSAYGARKPDPEVFRRVLRAYDCAAADAFFVDDLPENVAGAASVGITGHLYLGAAPMQAAIEAFALR